MNKDNHTISKAELEALDRLLEQLPGAPASPDLKSRIMLAAKDKRPAFETDNFTINEPPVNNNDNIEPGSLMFNRWTAGALMAASLILGIWGGFAGIGDAYLIEPLEYAGIDTTIITGDMELTGFIPGPRDAL